MQVVSAASAWVSVGFPSDGLQMVGADSVIGLPGDMSVMEYEMTGRVRTVCVCAPPSPPLPHVCC